MTHIELIQECINEYNLNLPRYTKMYNYYIGDTDAMLNYKLVTERTNNKAPVNMIKRFIKEETSYVLGNPLTYISKTGDENVISDITYNLSHWSDKHDNKLLKTALIYGIAIELTYINKNAEFCSKILTPRDCYVLKDDFDNIEMAIHFYTKKFDDSKYCDVYLVNTIEHYKLVNNSVEKIAEDTKHMFNEVPISLCYMSDDKEKDTLFKDLKGLQDCYETNLSDISNEISDTRVAYLKMVASKINEKDLKTMKEKGILQVPTGGDIDWLIKNINDSFLQNTLTTLKDNMYEVSGHINTNEKLSSNISGVALANRLISLTHKCKLLENAIKDCIKNRIRLMFKYLKLKENKNYDYKDIKCKCTLMIPSDDTLTAQIISQLGDKLSLETGLAQLSFVDNPKEEITKIKAEREDEINLDNISSDNGAEE